MPIILSLAAAGRELYGAGPDGLFLVQPTGALEAVPQPMQALYCCAAVDSLNGPVLLTGGAPHGAAARSLSGEWLAGWMDYTDAPVLQIAPAPDAAQTGVALAASGGAGVLRTTTRGRTWSLVNFGLREGTVLALAWAPLAPAGRWPARAVVFAGSEGGLYRSPAGGLGWAAVPGIEDAVQAIAVSPAFHDDGVVLAGTESRGLWRSEDGGRAFAPLPEPGGRIDALLATGDGWVAATPEGLWRSADSVAWRLLPDSPPALCLLETSSGLLAGGEFGVQMIQANGEK